MSFLLLNNKAQNFVFKTVISWVPWVRHLDRGPAVMTSLFCDIWGFIWKTQRLDWSWRILFQGGLVTWLGPLHWGITIGLLQCPRDMALAFPRASDSRGPVESDDVFYGLISEITDCYFWSFPLVTYISSDLVYKGYYTRVCILGGKDWWEAGYHS